MSKFDFQVVAKDGAQVEVHNPMGKIISPCTGKAALPKEKTEYLLFQDLDAVLRFVKARADLSQQTIKLMKTGGEVEKIFPTFKKENCSGKI